LRLDALVANSSTMVVSTAVSGLVGVVLVVVLTNALGERRYGQLAVITSITLTVRQILTVRIWEWALKEYARAATDADGERGAQVVRTGFLVGGAINLVAFVAVAGGARLAARWFLHDGRLATLVACYSLVLLLSWSNDTAFAVLRVAGRFRFLGTQQAVSAAVRLAAIGGAVLATHRLGATIAAYVGIEAFVAAWLYAAASATFRRTFGHSWWRRGGPTQLSRRETATLMGIGGVLDSVKLFVGDFDILLLGIYRSDTTVANYQAAFNFVDQINRLAVPVQIVAFADLAKLAAAGDGDALLQLVRRMMVLAAAAVVPLCLALSLGSSFLAHLVYRHGYGEVPGLLRILAWTLVALVSMWMQPAFVCVGRAIWGLQLSAAAAVLKLGVALLLVPRYGAAGLAASNLVYSGAFVVAIPVALARVRTRVASPAFAP
jgi:O-antigen/teichoic acid export membrane protein